MEVRFFGTAVDTFDVVGDRFSDLVTLNEGENRIQVVAIDAAGNRTTPSVPVEVFFVQSAFTDIPKRFGPGSEFFIGLLEPANRLLIHIFNLEGMLLQRIEGGAGDLVNIPWDGRDDRGQLLSSGPYIAVVEAFLNSGEVVRTRSAFVFSRTPVTAEDQ
ncbi:MAG: hypothetical protein HKN21_17025 [Candidatus Eisenbacteria bacterium]|uniref:FlgD/Vpr Ig-like domain-containing protein n=1 Tax=Eiseniibacteriota bacterium TaxID=2212470 RepID=A0A7Y2H457_UNCEI|nr:hypothetical protein [Candidatus Eisenbacteria bacterium]